MNDVATMALMATILFVTNRCHDHERAAKEAVELFHATQKENENSGKKNRGQR